MKKLLFLIAFVLHTLPIMSMQQPQFNTQKPKTIQVSFKEEVLNEKKVERKSICSSYIYCRQLQELVRGYITNIMQHQIYHHF